MQNMTPAVAMSVRPSSTVWISYSIMKLRYKGTILGMSLAVETQTPNAQAVQSIVRNHAMAWVMHAVGMHGARTCRQAALSRTRPSESGSEGTDLHGANERCFMSVPPHAVCQMRSADPTCHRALALQLKHQHADAQEVRELG